MARKPSSVWRVHSINFERPADDWVESLVDLLRRAGFPRPSRSEVVRVALSELQRVLVGHGSAETVKFFIERDAASQLARLDRSERDVDA
jgi:hypothetical protein